jgi:predicted RNase H-like nuclease (RuvC/YqgF family)
MKKITLLLMVPLALVPQFISGMNVGTKAPMGPPSNAQLHATVAQQQITIAQQENTIESLKAALQCISNVTKAAQTLDNRVYQLEQNLQNTHNGTQALENRIGHLEQLLRANQNSTTKKILSHPGTWFALIALYYLATKYYEHRHKEKIEKDEEQDTNPYDEDVATNQEA